MGKVPLAGNEKMVQNSVALALAAMAGMADMASLASLARLAVAVLAWPGAGAEACRARSGGGSAPVPRVRRRLACCKF